MNSDLYVNTHVQRDIPSGTTYKDFVRALVKPMGTETLDVLHTAVGISGEAGELLDAIKKVWVYNKEVDIENVIEELGDLNFYMTAMQILYGISDVKIVDHNIAKLAKRYPGGYTDQAAQERADKVIPEKLYEDTTIEEQKASLRYDNRSYIPVGLNDAMSGVTKTSVRIGRFNSNHAAEYAGAINSVPTPVLQKTEPIEQKHINHKLQSQMNRASDVCVFFSPSYIDANNFKYSSCSAEPESRFAEHSNTNEYQTTIYRGTPAWMEWYNKASKVPV